MPEKADLERMEEERRAEEPRRREAAMMTYV